MTQTESDIERLPLERPLREALRIYAKRLGVLLAIALANIVLLVLTIWLSRLPGQILVFVVGIVGLAGLLTVLERIPREDLETLGMLALVVVMVLGIIGLVVFSPSSLTQGLNLLITNPIVMLLVVAATLVFFVIPMLSPMFPAMEHRAGCGAIGCRWILSGIIFILGIILLLALVGK